MENPKANYSHHKLLSHNGRMIKPLEPIDGNTLLETEFPPLTFIVEEWLPTGTYLLVGAPKIGKSFFVQQVGVRSHSCQKQKQSIFLYTVHQ